MRMRTWLMASMVLCGIAIAVDHRALADDPAPASQPAPKPVNKFCPVQTDNPVDDRVPTYTYDGKVIGFCCTDCRDLFIKNPEQYLADMK